MDTYRNIERMFEHVSMMFQSLLSSILSAGKALFSPKPRGIEKGRFSIRRADSSPPKPKDPRRENLVGLV